VNADTWRPEGFSSEMLDRNEERFNKLPMVHTDRQKAYKLKKRTIDEMAPFKDGSRLSQTPQLIDRTNGRGGGILQLHYV